jgi:hypothetical protein
MVVLKSYKKLNLNYLPDKIIDFIDFLYFFLN